MTDAPHIPVLLSEVLSALMPSDGAVIVDGTLGYAGYTRAIAAAAACRVIGIDRDPAAIAWCRAAGLPPSVMLLPGRFGDMAALLKAAGIDAVNGVTLDLGVSSLQLDQPERGFSFRHDAPLDMRMSDHGATAADLVNVLDERDLTALIRRFGEERHAGRVARAIIDHRARQRIDRTAALAAIVRAVVPKSRDGIDPATRTFQALRIVVNDEIGELARGLAAAETLLVAGGRLAVVAFHSIEDRVVKNFLKARSSAPSISRHAPMPETPPAPSFRLITRKPIVPGEAEIGRNPRARSARLRVAERTQAPAWPATETDWELAA